MDDLFFTTSGEGPSATSMLLQGDGSLPHGLVYGQGVRCVGGRLERLFVKQAVAGSVMAPDFGAGDPAISTISASKGDVIPPRSESLVPRLLPRPHRARWMSRVEHVQCDANRSRDLVALMRMEPR
jgi:hypothetical protein